MALTLPVPFSYTIASTWKQLIEQADGQNFKKGQDVIVSPGRLILQDTAGNAWQITVSTSGVLSATAVTFPVTRGTSG